MSVFRSRSLSVVLIAAILFLSLLGLSGCGNQGGASRAGSSGAESDRLGDAAEDRSRLVPTAASTQASQAPVTIGAASLGPSEISDLIALRKQQVLEAYLDSPSPSPNSNNPYDRCWVRAAYSLAAFKSGSGTALAEQYIREIRSEFRFSDDATLGDPPCYFAIPLIWRNYLDPESHARLSEANREDLLEIMWSFVYSRSKVADAQGSVWVITMSENHDALQKSAYLLASRALMEAGYPYGPDTLLADGEDLETHYLTWLDYWYEYFKERALEGISNEVASPTYEKYTLSAYYGVRDFAGDTALESRATDFLALYWADVAQDFLPGANVRGGAATRAYKNAYLTRGSRQSTRDWLYIYQWHDEFSGRPHPMTLIAASSPYNPPDIVRYQATSRDRSHIYTSRRYGMGTSTYIDGLLSYPIRFDGEHGSRILRITHVTKDYALGAMSYSSSHSYNGLTGQNRSMGVQFASGPDDLIVIHGRGLDDNGRIGFNEINGLVSEGVLVVARDPSVTRSGATRVFISNGALWNNRVVRNGWFFTRAGDAYCAIRMPDAGYAVRSVGEGKMLDQIDSWTPIVVQMGQARHYAGFQAFQDSVLQNELAVERENRPITKGTLSSDRYALIQSELSYRTEAGDALVVHSHGRTSSTINEIPLDLAPSKTYSSPYLSNVYGSDTIELSHPLFETLLLDYSD